MDTYASPLRLIPPMTPRRIPSPTMSPGGRRGRTHGSSEESSLRDLSPDTTLRAFTQRPLPFDTTQDEYKIFACIETLTAAERDLGMRVAKAAQRLKTWCAEIEQWGWSGNFEPPSAAIQEQRRRSLEQRIREHVPDADLAKTLQPLEYWGSLLSDEVKHREARLDDIEEEMLRLDVEELKETVLDMHPGGRSRPSSAGFGATRQNYRPMDDFSFLITQTLLSALPHHAQLRDRLSTWTARVSILREAPVYMSEIETAQTAMRLGWEAIESPADQSDVAFLKWTEAVDTISNVLRTKVGHLGRRLDRMLDTLEGREDCLPDHWIDIFEGLEADYGQWSNDSRRSVIEFDIRRKVGRGSVAIPNTNLPSTPAMTPDKPTINQSTPEVRNDNLGDTPLPRAHTPTPVKSYSPGFTRHITPVAINGSPKYREINSESPTPSSPGITYHAKPKPSWIMASMSNTPPKTSSVPNPEPSANETNNSVTLTAPENGHIRATKSPQSPSPGSPTLVSTTPSAPSSVVRKSQAQAVSPIVSTSFVEDSIQPDDESFFEEGDTVIHNDIEDNEDIEGSSVIHSTPKQPSDHFTFKSPQLDRSVRDGLVSEDILDEQDETSKSPVGRKSPRKSVMYADSPTIITSNGDGETVLEPPHTPSSRRGSMDSLSSDMSFDASPTGLFEDSPSVRNATNRAVRAPRPELNAAMSKRRPAKSTTEDTIMSTPWPPTFTQKPINLTEDLEQKISDILTTIPAHIRLTTGPSADSPEVKPRRVSHKNSRGYLRPKRSMGGLKSPELTLSPAKIEPDQMSVVSGRKSSAALRADNDIKLYHLTQPGKEHPVKLFIRRVGENGERVMVRVGGGWADLGEYLRQYAEHHGRRTVSDGRFEILGLEMTNNNQDNSPARSESSMTKRDRGFSGSRSVTTPVTTPNRPSGLSLVSSDEVPPLPTLPMTPRILDETAPPSTNSSQRSWRGDEVGLAGPKSKKLDLSGEKLEWIEGMMKQARTVSGSVVAPPSHHSPLLRGEERADATAAGVGGAAAAKTEVKSSDDGGGSRTGSRTGARKEFGDLGKVGGTKRIFLRGGQPYVSEH